MNCLLVEHCKRASIKRICFKLKFVTASATEEKKGIHFEKSGVSSMQKQELGNNEGV
jgi:hypothetical protein